MTHEPTRRGALIAALATVAPLPADPDDGTLSPGERLVARVEAALRDFEREAGGEIDWNDLQALRAWAHIADALKRIHARGGLS